jgi:hypothetical protein
MSDSQSLTCYKHPNRETMLRCNKCDRPICSECAVLTPTGYRCKECVRGQQRVFNTAQPLDYILAVVAGAGLSYLGSYLVAFIGFFTIFAAPLAGVVIVEAIKKLTGNRRSRPLFIAASLAAIAGSLPLLIARLLPLWLGLQSGGFSLYGLLPIIWQAAYTILAAGSVYYRLTGIKIGS